MAVRTCLALFLLSCAACEGEGEQQARQQAAQISRAIDVLRASPNPEKAPRLAALQAAPCVGEDVCAVKQACVVAYQHHLAAVQGARAAKRAVAGDAGLGADAAGASAELAAQSEAHLEKARELNRKCLALQGALRRRHKL